MPGMSTAIPIRELHTILGTELGPTGWHAIEQSRIDAFAEVTGDHQWIHTDPERAANGPFGSTIAHGFLTLSLAPVLAAELLTVSGASLTVNYGLDRVRFPAPVPVGTAVRGRGVLTGLDEVAGGHQGTLTLTVERDGGAKPVCVADLVFRYYD